MPPVQIVQQLWLEISASRINILWLKVKTELEPFHITNTQMLVRNLKKEFFVTRRRFLLYWLYDDLDLGAVPCGRKAWRRRPDLDRKVVRNGLGGWIDAGRTLERDGRSYRYRRRRRRRCYRHRNVGVAVDHRAGRRADALEVLVLASRADQVADGQDAAVLHVVFQRYPGFIFYSVIEKHLCVSGSTILRS